MISTVNKNNQIIEMPTDLLPTLFDYLSLEDLQTCRQICNLWREFALNTLIERGIPKELVKTIKFVTDDTEKLKKIFSHFVANLGPKEKRHFTIHFPLQMEHFRLQTSWTGLENSPLTYLHSFSRSLIGRTNDFPLMSDAEQAITALETLYSEFPNTATQERHVIVIKTSDPLVTTADPDETDHLIAHLGPGTWTSSTYRNNSSSIIKIGPYVRSTGTFSHGVTEFRPEGSIVEVSNPLWEIVKELDVIQANQLEKIRQKATRKEELKVVGIVICIIAAIVYTTLQLNATYSSNEL